MSKLHQGSFSADAITNHLHEYFLTMKCVRDSDQTVLTEFSVKRMNDWGDPNEMVVGSEVRTNSSRVTSQLETPSGQPDPITDARFETITGAGGNREFERWYSVHTPYKWCRGPKPECGPDGATARQPELWSGNGQAHIRVPQQGTNGVRDIVFAPYYVVKNPIRILDTRDDGATYVLKPTVEACYGYKDGVRVRRYEPAQNQWQTDTVIPFCSLLPEQYPGPDFWKSPDSPFNGTVRALNFKGLVVQSQNAHADFCTDTRGENPEKIAPTEACADGTVRQYVRPVADFGSYDELEGNLGTIERSEFHYEGLPADPAKGKWRATHEASNVSTYGQGLDARPNTTSKRNPNGAGAYIGAGIGFEFIVNSDAEGIRAPN